MKNNQSLKNFYILWSTQSLSQLGSSMTGFALTLWLYEKTGSALSTAALTICTYAPYVVMSIFAGALSDKYNKKKTMLVCDALAALTTVFVFILFKSNLLSVWHLYAINVVSGLMNTVADYDWESAAGFSPVWIGWIGCGDHRGSGYFRCRVSGIAVLYSTI